MDRITGRGYVCGLIITAAIRSFGYASEATEPAATAFWWVSILIHAVCFFYILRGGVK